MHERAGSTARPEDLIDSAALERAYFETSPDPSDPQQKVVFDAIRSEADRDPHGVREARATLDKSYAWLDDHMATREWAAGASFSLADCGAAPFLFYADWTHPIDARFANVRAYRARLLARPSFRRAVEEARPYRPYFPLGAPDRD